MDTKVEQCNKCEVKIDVIPGYDKNIYPSGLAVYLYDECKEKEGFYSK